MIVTISERLRAQDLLRSLARLGINLDFCACLNFLQKSSIKQDISFRGIIKILLTIKI